MIFSIHLCLYEEWMFALAPMMRICVSLIVQQLIQFSRAVGWWLNGCGRHNRVWCRKHNRGWWLNGCGSHNRVWCGCRWCLNGCTLWYLVRNLYDITWQLVWFCYFLPFIGTRWTFRWHTSIKLYKTTKFQHQVSNR